MPILRAAALVALTLLVAAVLIAVALFPRPFAVKRGVITARQAVGAPLPAAPVAPVVRERTVGWREDFSGLASDLLPGAWRHVKKPGTRSAVFSVVPAAGAAEGSLRMVADRASSSIITQAEKVDLAQTPILRWRWRVTKLPDGADARDRSLDDQAIGVYVGSGSQLSNKSVSYHWDTETPKHAEGNAAYGLGGIRVKWITVRNKEDASGGRWYTEERNVAEDFKAAWGSVPDKVFVSISCNSQYTGSSADAELAWIEFVSL